MDAMEAALYDDTLPDHALDESPRRRVGPAGLAPDALVDLPRAQLLAAPERLHDVELGG
jgi:hypothetical protein